jgi:hypothetical protein
MTAFVWSYTIIQTPNKLLKELSCFDIMAIWGGLLGFVSLFNWLIEGVNDDSNTRWIGTRKYSEGVYEGVEQKGCGLTYLTHPLTHAHHTFELVCHSCNFL